VSRWVRGGTRLSFRLDAGGFDDAGPSWNVRLDDGREFRWAGGDRLKPERHEALLHVRQCNSLDDARMEQSGNIFRRSGWSENADPRIAFDFRKARFAYGRYIRKTA
jgi:hypothetical protein